MILGGTRVRTCIKIQESSPGKTGFDPDLNIGIRSHISPIICMGYDFYDSFYSSELTYSIFDRSAINRFVNCGPDSGKGIAVDNLWGGSF